MAASTNPPKKLSPDEPREGIWLEVSEVRIETGTTVAAQNKAICSVLLKADREQPKPVWWPVNLEAAGEQDAFKTYRAILHELDKKRIVLAWLTRAGNGADRWLECGAFRFQSPEALGNR